ncbi:carboxypeptidase-like regulatory domain-containing protein [Portibacter marinus]|uniref:carboxypeptidase-like regulatory domain-containing protein n=1 Tax=Portibacter marinus TaxID=2898660 RepID=UPI001F39E806|nr:carboxypeptidase-like regulatory domain-containing protein [Portibacter marinus]
MKNIILIIVIATVSCQKAPKFTTVSGQVIDYGSAEPIENATIRLIDGWRGSNPIIDSEMHTDNETVTLTDANGEFNASIDAAYDVFLFPSKSDEYWPYDLGVTGITNKANGYAKGSDTSNEVLRLKAKAFTEGRFKDSQNQRDSVIVYRLMPDLIAHPWNTYSNPNGEALMPNGNALIIGNDYYRYKIEYKRNGEWNSLIDSIYLEKGETFTDTIYY